MVNIVKNPNDIGCLLNFGFQFREECGRECEKSNECEYYRLVPSHSPNGENM